jgi:hypothetical protein
MNIDPNDLAVYVLAGLVLLGLVVWLVLRFLRRPPK